MKVLKAVVIILVICLANPPVYRSTSQSSSNTYDIKKGESMVYTEKSVNGVNSTDFVILGDNNYAYYNLNGNITLKVTIVNITLTQGDINSFTLVERPFIRENIYISGQNKYTSSNLTQLMFQTAYSSTQNPLHDIYVIPAFNTTQQVQSSRLYNPNAYPTGYNITLTDQYLILTYTQALTSGSSLKIVFTNSYNWHTGWLEYKNSSIYNQNRSVSSIITEKAPVPTPVPIPTTGSTAIPTQTNNSGLNEQLLLGVIVFGSAIVVLAISILYYNNYRKYKQKTNSTISFWKYYKRDKSIENQGSLKDSPAQQHPQDVEKALEKIEDILKENSLK